MPETKQLIGILNSEKHMVGEINNQNALYAGLFDKPSINGIVLLGNKTSADLHITEDKTFIHEQKEATTIWRICHNLKKYPAVTVCDSAGTVVCGEVNYIDLDTVEITFSAGFSGKCYCN